MKIGILYEVWGETEEYPGAKDTDDDDTTVRRRRKRPKLDREEVFQALTKLGHEPSYIELDGRDATLFALAKSKVDLVFNLAESYAGDDSKDMNIPAFMDLVGVHYTGSGPHGLLLAQDKALAKKIVEETLAGGATSRWTRTPPTISAPASRALPTTAPT